MKLQNKFVTLITSLLVLMLFTTSYSWARGGWGGGGGGDPVPPEDPIVQKFDTSFAVEYSYSCLSGGCHENNQSLVDEYSQSVMTHAMVKCNTCHGTHTADEVGTEKPNITGHHPGIGATGYTIPRDRCLACHNNTPKHQSGSKASSLCKSCHTPHVFAPPSGGGGGPGGRW